jgi:hypothetical protein
VRVSCRVASCMSTHANSTRLPPLDMRSAGLGTTVLGGCRHTFLCFNGMSFCCACCVEFSPVNDQFSKPWCLMLM